MPSVTGCDIMCVTLQVELAEFQRSEELTAQQRRQRNMAHRQFLEKQIVEVRLLGRITAGQCTMVAMGL